jgi:chromosome segregation ATPase
MNSLFKQNGLEACSERLKALEAELDRAHHESLSLKNEVELALKAKNQIQGSLSDRNAVIQSLTETIETLVRTFKYC